MNTTLKEILLIDSLDIVGLIEQYREFFLAIIPGIFILAVLVEYFDRLAPLNLLKRVFIAIIILTSVSTFYETSINASMFAADEILNIQKTKNVLLLDFFGDMMLWNPESPKYKEFFKDDSSLKGALSFLKYHLFSSYINDFFTLAVYLITNICFIILKVVYSLVYYMGYALIGIPCLLYIFPTMGNVLRGAILSYVWCLVMPHVVAIIISIIGSEINKGYVSGEVIGGTLSGTALLIVFSLFLALSPMITAMILNGSGISQAGGIIATLGANKVLSIPSTVLKTATVAATGGALGPKAKVVSNIVKSASSSLKAGSTITNSQGVKNTTRINTGKSNTNRNSNQTSKVDNKSNTGNRSTNNRQGKVSTQNNSKKSSINRSDQNNATASSSKSNAIILSNNDNKSLSSSSNIQSNTIQQQIKTKSEKNYEKVSNSRTTSNRNQKENTINTNHRINNSSTNSSNRIIRTNKSRK